MDKRTRANVKSFFKFGAPFIGFVLVAHFGIQKFLEPAFKDPKRKLQANYELPDAQRKTATVDDLNDQLEVHTPSWSALLIDASRNAQALQSQVNWQADFENKRIERPVAK